LSGSVKHNWQIINFWTLTASGEFGFSGNPPPPFQLEADITSFVRAGDTLTLSESGPAGYTARHNGQFSCSVDGGQAFITNTITLSSEESAICEITNVEDTLLLGDTQLTLKKTVINDLSNNFADDWTLETTFTDGLPNVMNMTGEFSEVGTAFFDLPKIYDLPIVFDGTRQLVDLKSKCTPISGSEFKIGNTTVACIGYDLSGNSNHTSFTVEITPNKDGLRIKNVTAAGNAPGLNNGDKVFVEFTVPTNQPPVATTADLDTLFNVTNGTLTGTSGKFLDPSTLLITINNATSADLDPDTTVFDLRFTNDHELLQSASGSLNSTGFNNRTNPIPLAGNFSLSIAPYITSLMVMMNVDGFFHVPT